jgi:hypothetical protein
MIKMRRGKYWPLDKKVLKRMYLKEYKSLDEIAKHFEVSKTKVHYYFKKYGIKPIEEREHYNLKKFTKRQKEYLFGSLLGDDSLILDRKYPTLSVSHSINQRAYVKWKYEIWKRIVPGGIKKNVPIKVNGNIYFIDRFQTIGHPEFVKFYRLFYSNGEKIVTKEILDNLTPFSITVWYMDDGCYNKLRKRAILATNSFTYEENLLIQKYFKNVWNISSHIGTHKNGTYYIWFNTENTIKFFKIIKNYVLPFFDYKIDKNLKLKKLSSEEIQYIIENYKSKPAGVIARKLNRPQGTIYSAAYRLGLTNQR